MRCKACDQVLNGYEELQGYHCVDCLVVTERREAGE